MDSNNLYNLVKSKATVSFTTKNESDSTHWIGKIVASSVTYDIAKNYMDVQTYNNMVRKYDQQIETDCTKLIYFIFKLDENTIIDSSANTSNLYAFAEDWINMSNFELRSNYTECTINVYIPTESSPEQVINILSSVGFPCNVIK